MRESFHSLDEFASAARSGYPRKVITGGQIRAARSLLGWSASELGKRSGLSWATIQRAESADGVPNIMGKNLNAIVEALEAAGVVLLEPDDQRGEGRGVRFTQKRE